MRLELILADRCPTCAETERVWTAVCSERSQELAVVFTNTDRGRRIVERLALRTFPALLADDRVWAVGAPSEGTARDTLGQLLAKQPARAAAE